MSEELGHIIDLELAWRRVREDVHDERVFVRRPFDIELVEADLGECLNGIKREIEQGTYEPGPLYVVDVPKPGGAIRPGAYLKPEDQLVYSALLGVCFPDVVKETSWAQGVVDFCYQYSESVGTEKWFKNRFKSWVEFREASLSKLKNHYEYVVVTDISAYYEMIDLDLLMSDLAELGINVDVLSLLRKCLYKWAEPLRRGIPQAYSPSDILGKIYLNKIDKTLGDLGYNHIRYVDDIRVFCKKELDAKKALKDLIALLRDRGLVVQTAKTQILNSESAEKEFEGVIPVIKKISADFTEEIAKNHGYDLVSASPDSIAELIRNLGYDPELETVREAFRLFFVDKIEKKFDKTLFHYLINRLGDFNDNFAVGYSISYLKTRPEETYFVLKYFKKVGAYEYVINEIVDFLESDSAVYDYQNYLIIKWVLENTRNKALERVLRCVRRYAFDTGIPYYVRGYAKRFLSVFGETHDFERLKREYSTTVDIMERAETLCNIKKMELRRRNSFYGRVENETALNRRAIKLVKNKII